MKRSKQTIIVIFLLIVGSAGVFALGSKDSAGHRFSGKSLSGILDGRKDVRFFAKALHDTGLDVRLNELDGYTLFVPTDEAVEKMNEKLKVAMAERPDVLSEVIKDIMVKGVYSSGELVDMGKVRTMGSITLEIEGDTRHMKVAGSDSPAQNLYGAGFVVHIVSGIIVRDIKL